MLDLPAVGKLAGHSSWPYVRPGEDSRAKLMSFRLYQLIEGVTNGWNLAALVAILIAGLLYKKNRELSEVLRAAKTADRLKTLYAILWRFEIDTQSLSPEQKLQLATDQLEFRHRAQRQRWLFLGFIGLLLTAIFVSGLNKIMPDRLSDREITGQKSSSPTSSPQTQGSDTQDRVIAEAQPKQLAVLPFAVRLISDRTMEEEEFTPNEIVSVTVSSNQSPIEVSRDGDFFLARIGENESISIHIVVRRAGITLQRTVVISGYTASQVPCHRRTIYLAKLPMPLTTKVVQAARQSLEDVSNCSSVDKAVVLWGAIRNSASPKKLPPSVKNISHLIEYSDKANYNACISLGYEHQCGMRSASHNVKTNTPAALSAAYARHRQTFDSRDYLAAARFAEELLLDFDMNFRAWEQIRISRSRLHADAAVSWLHFGDGLSYAVDAQERQRQCTSFRKALYHAQHALWQDFRQRHVPIIETRIKKACTSADRVHLSGRLSQG
jgi:hypothetical protein